MNTESIVTGGKLFILLLWYYHVTHSVTPTMRNDFSDNQIKMRTVGLVFHFPHNVFRWGGKKQERVIMRVVGGGEVFVY